MDERAIFRPIHSLAVVSASGCIALHPGLQVTHCPTGCCQRSPVVQGGSRRGLPCPDRQHKLAFNWTLLGALYWSRSRARTSPGDHRLGQISIAGTRKCLLAELDMTLGSRSPLKPPLAPACCWFHTVPNSIQNKPCYWHSSLSATAPRRTAPLKSGSHCAADQGLALPSRQPASATA
jgi:hypothetical protein